jgi:outer membrane receptor for ferrienterochelin and colicin
MRLIFLLCLLGGQLAVGQKIMGVVVEKNEKGVEQPLPGANVYWLGTTLGTTTKDNGVFMIDRQAGQTKLVISYVGYRSDTLNVESQNSVKVELKSETVLQEVTVTSWRSTSSVDYASGINRIVMDEKELFKAACCNLSESFETNPAVDVAFTDAVTGTRQIQMLGLAGPNTLITIENMPGVRGLASSQGIQFIPGTWINSIQVTKGVGSVVNGYESIAGQINVELKKPQESERLYLNGYVNNAGRSEANIIYTAQPFKKWGTTFLIHGSTRPFEMDQNRDSFLDFPLGNQINLVNRWVFNSGTGWLGQFSVKYLEDTKQGGQSGFDRERDRFTTNRYGLEINTARAEFTGKLGYQFAGKPYKSVGLQINALQHRHESYYGFTMHDARERSLYSNLIYQSIIQTTAHKFKAGVSIQVTQHDEYFDQSRGGLHVGHGGALQFNRFERVPGAFVEYTYDYLDKFSLIAGARVDQHNLFGTLFTPRLHTRYSLTPTTVVRASAGRGLRVANLLIENTGILASSREVLFRNLTANAAYGFRPDKAWNYGFNFNQEFELNYRPGSFSFDYFYTNFQDQAVLDLDANPQAATFFGLRGKSFSHSVQAQMDYQIVRRLDVRLAYRWLDVQTDYTLGRFQRPLIPRDRAFLNIAYATKNNWKFDFTLQRVGKQRIPFTFANPTDFQLPEFSDPYWLANAQVSKDFGDRWSVYVGLENITNFRLDNPIVAASDPFGMYFDSSMVWGPVFGRMWYTGFRYRVAK